MVVDHDHIMKAAACFVLLMMVMLAGRPAQGADPDITTDFGINVTSVAQLQFTGFRDLPPQGCKQIKITFAFRDQFPGVTGLGIAPSLIQFGPAALNSLHSHPRASEIFFMMSGEVEAGIVDTKNRLFTSIIEEGHVFIFPKGLMHYQINKSKTKPATALAAFNSENAGRVSIPPAIFNSEPRIPSDILVQALNLDLATVKRLENTQF